MSQKEIVEILRNDGFITVESKILVNLVSRGDDHIMMFGDWFVNNIPLHSNEEHHFGHKINLVMSGAYSKIWDINGNTIVHHMRETKLNSVKFSRFKKIQELKKRYDFDFDDVQKALMEKFNGL